MFIVTVHFSIEAAHVEAFAELMALQARHSLEREEGCRVFDVCIDADRPTEVFLYEKYDTGDDFKAHLATPHFLDFDQQVAPWTRSKSVRTWTALADAS